MVSVETRCSSMEVRCSGACRGSSSKVTRLHAQCSKFQREIFPRQELTQEPRESGNLLGQRVPLVETRS